MNVGARIVALREEKLMTQLELASRLSVSQPFIAQIERGSKALSLHMAIAIAKIFCVDIEELIE